MGRLGFAIACCALLAATSAQAQVTSVTGNASTNLNLGSATGVYPMGAFVENIKSGGSSFDSNVTIDPKLVSFESGIAMAGSNLIKTTSSTSVNITFMNNTTATQNNVQLDSTIIPAGLGFYLADTPAACGFTGCPLTTSGFTFSDLHAQGGGGSGGGGQSGGLVLASVGFDFAVLNDGAQIYHLNGALNLMSQGGVTFIQQDFGDAPSILNNFAQVTPVGSQNSLGYAWDATNIALNLGNLAAGASKTVTYVTTVNSLSKLDCLSTSSSKGAASSDTCLLAYSGFGDPVGRGGGIDSLAATSALFFSLIGGAAAPSTDTGGGITDINFSPATFNFPTYNNGVLGFQVVSGGVPEPATWISLILGFGLLGTMLRRRRGFAAA